MILEKIKKMPLSVKLAITFLTLPYVLMCVMMPIVGIVLPLIGVLYWSITRIFTYFTFNE